MKRLKLKYSPGNGPKTLDYKYKCKKCGAVNYYCICLKKEEKNHSIINPNCDGELVLCGVSVSLNKILKG